ncbi:MAG TPA: hypothetical protein PL143_08315 [Rhodocyclaceae bacterium]|nr:hypothetical protein [Rhodocyclaceae bacterium]
MTRPPRDATTRATGDFDVGLCISATPPATLSARGGITDNDVDLMMTRLAMTQPLRALIERWKHDPGSTCSTWFPWDERSKNFRSIRRRIARVVEDIEAGSFGNA